MKALALLEAPDHVCGRYRVSAFASSLVSAGWSLAVEGIASSPLSRSRQLRRASRYDTVILQRKLLPAWQLAILRRSSRRLLFDFDDAVLYRDSYDARGPNCRRRAARFARTVRAADLILAGNRFLARCATEHGASADRTRVIPTCIETTDYRPKPVDAAIKVPPCLVWVGSSSTLQGLEQKRPMLERLGREVPGLKLRVIADRFPAFLPLVVQGVMWNAATEAEDLSAADIGISWVPDDLWSRGKCGLKVLQYQAAGLPVIANPVGVHPDMIAEGRTGFLPKSDDEWIEAVKILANDTDRCRRMGHAARRSVEERYSVSAWSSRFVAAVTGPGAIPPPNVRPPGQAVRR